MGKSESPLPGGMDLSMLNPDFRENPDKVYELLRSEAPVYQDNACDRVVLTRAHEVGLVLNDRSMHVDPRKSRPTSLLRQVLRVDDSYKPTLVFMDDPDHKRLRGLLTKEFNQQAVDSLRPRIKEVASQLLDSLTGQSRFDVIEAYAKPLPMLLIGMLLGVDEADLQQFKDWSVHLSLGFNPHRTAEQQAQFLQGKQSLRDYLLQAIQKKRRQPDNKLISKLISAEHAEDVSESEIVSLCEFLMVAGNVTTTDLIGNAVYALLKNPSQLAKLKEQPGLAADMVEETLRYDSPVTSAIRIATCPMKMNGTTIEAGQSITSFLMAANHDPAAYPSPYTFDIERKEKKHHAFGGGAHFCLGAPLARAEGQIAIPLIFEQFPHLRLNEDAAPPVRKAIPSISGFETLWVETGA
jgi:cytochrome P450